jgi:PhzF family phenazine biosynthesis protein
MKTYTLYQLDAFTKHRFTGNPAGVVLNADGLTELQMQQIARELNHSETAFLFAPNSRDCDGAIRYFTPQVEVPTCGHATIAALSAKALDDHLDSCVFRLKTRIGVLPCDIIKTPDAYTIIMTQGPAHLEAPLASTMSAPILRALGVTPADIDPRCPIQIASTGHAKVMIGLKSRDMLNSLTPNFAALTGLSAQIHCNGYFVFTLDRPDEATLVHGRMFAPAIGVNEDPVTGNANGPLGAYLLLNHVVQSSAETLTFRAKQGEAMGRPGIITVTVRLREQASPLVQIHGEAVVVFKTAMVV